MRTTETRLPFHMGAAGECKTHAPVIAFGVAITKPEMHERAAAPGIRRAAEPGAVVLARPAAGTIAQSYNQLLEAARDLRDLEALVLVHQDTELMDEDFCAIVRPALAEPD